MDDESGMKLPLWLNEGLAEFFSTLSPIKGGLEVGGPLPTRMQALRKQKCFPLPELLNIKKELSLLGGRKSADLFYAQSWALVDMLMTSPSYAGHFRELIAEISAGNNALVAFRNVYRPAAIGRPLCAH